MRRPAHTIRGGRPGRRWAALWPHLRGSLARILLMAAVFGVGCPSSLHGQSGVITTAVGPHLSIDNQTITNATLALPSGVAVDSSGSAPIIYTADAYNCVVWKTQSGASEVRAGVYGSAYNCTGGAATSSPFTTPLAFPVSVAFCGGNLFIASNGLDPILLSSTTDTAGTLDEVDASGTLTVLPIPGAQTGYGSLHPVAVACDANGNVYLSAYSYGEDSVFTGLIEEFQPRIGGGWIVSSPVPNVFQQVYPSIAIDPATGDLFALLDGQAVQGWIGGPLLTSTSILNITQNRAGVSSGNSFHNADALAFDAGGNMYISEAAGYQDPTSYVEAVAFDGTKTIIAGTGTPGYFGDGGIGTLAQVDGVNQMVFDSSGYLYLADSANQRIRRMHLLTTGAQTLTVNPISVPQSSSPGTGSLQAALNPSGTVTDFYFISGSNLLDVVSTGTGVASPGFERIVAIIPVGQGGSGGTSNLTLVADPTRNLIYVDNVADGNLYVIDGSYGTPTSHTVIGSVALDNPNANLLAVDTGLNELYVAGPNATGVSAVQGGASPTLIGNTSSASLVSSLSVDPASHVVYAVSDTGSGTGTEEGLYVMTPLQTGALAITGSVFPAEEDILQAAFIPDSIAADPVTGSLIAAGAASLDPLYAQTRYQAYDFFQFPLGTVSQPVTLTWPPITTSLDIPNRTFYLTDFDGTVSDASSNALMVTGMDSLATNGDLISTPIPVFGSGVTPSSPHVFDIEPDTARYQAWISGSDATYGGFLELWDSGTQAVLSTAEIPNNGGGHVFIDSTTQSGYLLDEVNGLLWLINTPPWTTTPTPTFTPSQNGDTVTIAAVNGNDTVYYTTDGTPPSTSSPLSCASSCIASLAPGVFTTINAIEVADSAGTPYASNVVQGIFTVPAATALTLTVSPSPASTGATITATAVILPAPDVASVTGSVTFTATFDGSPTTLCSAVSVQNSAGSWQASCPFSESAPGAYTIAATYTGDLQNLGSSNNVPLQVNQSTAPVLGTVSGNVAAIAVNFNSSPGISYNAVLNSDSSVSLIQNGALLSGQGCPAFSDLSQGVSSGAVYIDAANSRIYLAMLSGGTLYAAYESLGQQGNCTLGPLLMLSSSPNQRVELGVDAPQGNVYVLNSFGGLPDSLYILPAPWNSSPLPTPAEVTLDYSAQYGPIVIDPSNHQVYINDLGGFAFAMAGTYPTSGFFVYDPNHTSTPASNLQHVAGYVSGGVTTAFNIGTLLDNGTGTLVLINENPSYASANLAAPITIIDTTNAGFSFFSNTSSPAPNEVDITGAGISTISAVASYSALGGADIDVASGLVYAYAFNANNLLPGMLLEYNLSPTAGPQETVLSSSMAMPVLYTYIGPWNQLNYDAESTQVVLSANAEGSGALAVTSPLCAGSPSLTSLVGNAGNPIPLTYPAVNAVSGYIYAVQAPDVDFVAPASGQCSTAPLTLQISTTTLPPGTAETPYTATLNATGGLTPYTWSISVGSLPAGLALAPGTGVISGPPTTAGTYNFTVSVQDAESTPQIASAPLSITIGQGVTPGKVTDDETILVSDAVKVTMNDIADSEVITVSDAPQVWLSEVYDTEKITVADNISLVGSRDINDTETITVTDTVGAVVPSATSLLLTGPATAAWGQNLMFRATISHTGTAPLGGTIIFDVDGAAVSSQSISRTNSASYSTDTLSIGMHTISASFSGNNSYDGSQSAPLAVTIAKAVTVTTLSIAPSPATSGQPVTFTAIITPTPTGTSAGTVTFECGNYFQQRSVVSIPPIPVNNGVAVWADPSVPGFDFNHCFTAIYSGNQDLIGSQSPLESLTVADFQMNFSAPSGVYLLPGHSATFTTMVTPLYGPYNYTVDFAATGLPPGATATFNPAAVTPGATPVNVTVTITAPPLRADGRAVTRPWNRHPIMLALLLPLAGLRRIRRKLRGIFPLVIALLSLAVLAGVSACGSSGFFNQPPQSYSVTLTGTSGAAQHSTTFSLTVQ